MFLRIINWRWALAFIAIIIVSVSIFYSNFLAKKIAAEEKIKIEQWVEALKDINDSNISETHLSSRVLTENSKDIPMIAVTESGEILDYRNLDSLRALKDIGYLREKIKEFASLNEPVIWQNPHNLKQNNLVYYGESLLLKQIRYFPIIQLLVVALFIIITLIAIGARNKSTQNQVWAGMAKETAHQLGTPISSLQGWVELLKSQKEGESIAVEMDKDVERLKLVSDRFSKIGSTPQLEETEVVSQIKNMVEYLRRRAPEKVLFHVHTNEDEIKAFINPPLFDWVIENLLKNALDAMEGKGEIKIDIHGEAARVLIDVSDTGKGILKKNIPYVFKPGFSTKKRGWGLGLSLSKRIIEQYHKGEIFVKHSDSHGTTFRILLRK